MRMTVTSHVVSRRRLISLYQLSCACRQFVYTMHALHQTLLPPSAVHHSLYVPHLTPSTIYPFPAPPSSTVKVIGNLVVAGGQDLRVFEIREQVELDESATPSDGDVSMEENEPRDPALDDGFFDSEPPHVRCRRYLSDDSANHSLPRRRIDFICLRITNCMGTSQDYMCLEHSSRRTMDWIESWLDSRMQR